MSKKAQNKKQQVIEKKVRRIRPDKKKANPLIARKRAEAEWLAKTQQQMESSIAFQVKELRSKLVRLDAALGRAVKAKDSELIQQLYNERAEARQALRKL